MADGDINCGRMILMARLRAGITQRDLAHLLGVSQQRVAYLEHSAHVRSDTLERIGTALRVRFAVGGRP
jgi:transcriptional regulator with XRE-family HTH domain